MSPEMSKKIIKWGISMMSMIFLYILFGKIGVLYSVLLTLILFSTE